jgi:hypothetical protein
MEKETEQVKELRDAVIPAQFQDEILLYEGTDELPDRDVPLVLIQFMVFYVLQPES